MKKVIKGKLYDTETAKQVGRYDNGKFTNDFGYFSEDLYLKKTGEFFLDGFGGAFTKYDGIETITPISYEEAQAWAEEHLDGDEYLSIFGEPEEDDSKVALNIYIKADVAKKLKTEAAKQGKSVGEIIESLMP